jgi:type I restriction-modification system DNA methylase subunit
VTLAGQESIGSTWAICKMNMLLHGIDHADIRQEDTIRHPQHIDSNTELRRFDRVLANPPFSQNYIRKEVEYAGRFAVWMPEKGKKADLMFVQHMLAVLKSNGRMATIMPHGVLFRGGEEKAARKYFIEHGWLDAVIGLPPALFYGTGIPGCVLVMSKEGAANRKEALFINADREYREGRAQNFLRPEDISKIVHVYRNKLVRSAPTRYSALGIRCLGSSVRSCARQSLRDLTATARPMYSRSVQSVPRTLHSSLTFSVQSPSSLRPSGPRKGRRCPGVPGNRSRECMCFGHPRKNDPVLLRS